MLATLPDHIRELSDFKGETPEQQALFNHLSAHGIGHTTYAHPPIFTVDEGLALGLHEAIPGQGCKSLFVKTPSGELWLVVATEDTRVDLKKLAGTLGVKRFSFAKPETMVEILGVTPGSATPFALLKDVACLVNVVIEEALLHSPLCVFHPLDNRFSTVIAVNDLLRFVESTGRTPKILALA